MAGGLLCVAALKGGQGGLLLFGGQVEGGGADKTLLDTSFALDHKNPCLANGMGNVLRSDSCMENITGLE
jgi:hypothetical protein